MPRGVLADLPSNSMLRLHIVRPHVARRRIPFGSGGFMSDMVHRSLHALIAEHGDGLLARPDLCERLLREAAPGQDEKVRVVAMALADGVPRQLDAVVHA